VKRLVVATLPFSAGCIYGCGPHEVQFNVAYPEDDAGVAIMDAGCDALCSVRGFETLESCMKAPNEVECVAVLPSTGRRPAELVRVDSWTSHVVANWSAAAAQMEAASVPAFEILARELAAHDAPSSLIARALESADDERRHARIMTSLARAHGATPGPVRVVVREPRALEAIARENAVEGLVREAYGARVAIDAAIAADEARHAALAALVHAWIRPRLSYAARVRVDEARAAARAQLIAECAVELAQLIQS
jgi:hypothetical protein